jgi:glycosyltransferase involved in cell wall biosynthesis
MVRVLHLVKTLQSGGAQTAVSRIVLASPGGIAHDVCLTGWGDVGPLASPLIAHGARIFMAHQHPFCLFRNKGLAGVIAGGRYAVVHSHLDSESWPALSVAARLGVRARLIHYHSAGSAWRGRGIAHSYAALVGRLAERSATAIVGCSASTLSARCCSSRLRESKGLVVYNPIPVAALRASADREGARAELGLPPDALVVGHAGRFASEKNHKGLVAIAARAMQEVPEAYLLLVGDGPERAAVEQAVAARGLGERVIFAGYRSDIGRALSAMDVFALPSFREGFPIAAVEAQAISLPVVAYDIPGMREAVAHADLLAPVSDEPEAARILLQLLEDASARRERGARAAEWAERFDVSLALAPLWELYRGAPG